MREGEQEEEAGEEATEAPVLSHFVQSLHLNMMRSVGIVEEKIAVRPQRTGMSRVLKESQPMCIISPTGVYISLLSYFGRQLGYCAGFWVKSNSFPQIQ